MSAIPCLSYKRALEEEKRLKECLEQETTESATTTVDNQKDGTAVIEEKVEPQESNGNDDETKAIAVSSDSNQTTDDQPQPAKKPRIFGAFSNAKIETVKENLKEQSLTINQINEYCKDLFVFKNIRVMRFT